MCKIESNENDTIEHIKDMTKFEKIIQRERQTYRQRGRQTERDV